VIADLNRVAPYDWARFIHDRIEDINPRANLAGIERGGYRLVYADKPTKGESTEAASGSARGTRSMSGTPSGSAWLRMAQSWTCAGVARPTRAADARTKDIAVNGMVFTGDGLKAAVREAKGKTEPIHLILQTDTFRPHGGPGLHAAQRYPSSSEVQGRRIIWTRSHGRWLGPPAVGAQAFE